MKNIKPEDEKIFGKDESDKFIGNRITNVKSDLIEITEVKLENILLKNLNKLEIRKSWIAPLSVFIAVLLAKLTTTFKTAFGINASVWEALFLLIIVISFIWLIVVAIKIFFCWKESSLDNLMKIIKNTTTEKMVNYKVKQTGKS